MSKSPAFLFYSADFLVGTSFLTFEEKGRYIHVLCLLHQHGGYLPKDKVEAVIGKLSDMLLEKFSINEKGDVFNERLLREMDRRKDFCESRRKNVMKRYEDDTLVSTSVDTSELRMDNENEKEKDIKIDSSRESVREKKEGRKSKLTDDEWIASLKNNSAYDHIDIDKELKKMDAWLTVNPKRQKTRRFILSWLNRIDAPVKAKGGNKFDGYETDV